MTERDIFTAALAREDRAERAAFLNSACAGDAALRARVESLLAEHQQLGSFMDVPSQAVARTVDLPGAPPVAECPGTVIGPYKLLQPIGEGGMGVVYMAEQAAPVRRKVALKIIKPGMDTREVIARFEAERQALALMDHPNIARVFDGGATEACRPYFVMELVRGVPITDYCDQNNLPIHERLELFVTVCHAVQHAHQKGIIHRDIKPSNVLVTMHDGRPVPKVIDFGVAKAIGQQLTDMTMFTQFAQMVGTPLYMSPEQAQLTGLDVDTRGDIYSLGVLLYELLTGTTPFEGGRMRKAAIEEIRRMIREEEPPSPSTRLSSTAGESQTAVAAHRHIDPKGLSRLVRGDLDWIVMKALEKDRTRRYETANGFAADVLHYLADEPVDACPPSALYRFGKFSRRNKSGLAVAGLVLFFIVLLGGGAGWAMRDRAAREEQLAQERAARQAKASGQLEQILDELARLEQAEKWSEALASARRAEPLLAADEAALETQLRVRQALVDLELVQRLEEIRMQSGTAWGDAPARRWWSVRADAEYAAALSKVGIDIDALPLEQAVDRITSRRAIAAALLPALDDWVAVRSLGKDEAATRRLIDVLQHADTDPWRQRMRDAVARKDWPALTKLTTSADLDRQPAATLTFLNTANEAGESVYPEPQFVLRRAQWKYPADFWINHRLGVTLIWTRNPDQIREGIGYMRAAVAVRPQSAHALMNLGNGYEFLGQHDQAIACHRKALELAPGASGILSNLGLCLSRKGAHEEAIASLEQAIKLSPRHATEAYAELSLIHSSRPDSILRKPQQAVELAGKAIEIEPNFSNHWLALGIARYRNREWQEARAALDKSLLGAAFGAGGAFRWEEAIDWFFLAMCCRQLGQEEEARRCYATGVAWMEENQPNSAQLIRFRTEAAELLGAATDSASPLKGEPAKVEAEPSKAIEPTPDRSEAEKGRAAYFARQEAKAVEEFSHAIELAPDRWEAWNARAWFYCNRQQWEKAVTDFSKAIELAPQVHTNWWHRGHCYLNLAQWDKAATEFGKIVDQWPDGSDGWYLRAVARAHLNQPEQATADLRQAIAKGFRSAEQIKNDPHFAALLSREDFGKLLEELAQKEKLKGKESGR